MESMIGMYAGMGLLLILVCLPMIFGVIPPNRSIGFRTSRTLADQNVWYPANRIAGEYLAIAGLLIMLTTVLVSLFPSSLQPKTAGVTLLTVSLTAMAGAVALSFAALRRL